MKEKLQNLLAIFVLALLIFMTIVMFLERHITPQCNFQCATCENAAKTENAQSEDGDWIYLQPWQIITEIWIKAGNACYEPDGQCYVVADGGIGYSYVKVERLGDGPECQAISHIEVCYEETEATPTYTDTPIQEESPTFTPTPSSTPTSTETPEDPTSTYTPTVEDTPTSTEPVDTNTPSPTKTDIPERTPNGNGLG